MSPPLLLVPIYLGSRPELLHHLDRRLGAAFGTAVERRAPWFDPEVAFDPDRGQYRSGAWLAELRSAATGGRVLAITAVDLFIPVLTWVFGEAELPGRAAAVSIHRLDNRVYGLPPDDDLLLERAEKEAIHELGHTWGLIHCADPVCVMHASTYVEEIDLKPATFCPGCLRVVRGGPLSGR